MKELMAAFRVQPAEDGRRPEDHRGLRLPASTRSARSTAPAATRPLPEPSGDLLIFHTEAAGTRFAARPSGTEPKIKFYLFARTAVDGPDAARRGQGRDQRNGLTGWPRDIEQFITADAEPVVTRRRDDMPFASYATSTTCPHAACIRCVARLRGPDPAARTTSARSCIHTRESASTGSEPPRARR